jgi:lipid-binding SYLF domain-containing protein
MTKRWTLLGAGLLTLSLTAATLRAGPREVKTVEDAAETIRVLADIRLRGIPQGLLRDAQGVAILPGVVRAGFVVDGRFGRGVVLARQADGNWGNPAFVSLAGGGLGWQVGVQSTDLVLVFMTGGSVNRILKGKGKLTLGADASVAAGPVGREAAAATDAKLRAEIYSYSRSRGLFAGLSLEGAALRADPRATAAFYGIVGGPPSDYAGPRGAAAAANLRGLLTSLGAPPPPSVIVVPPALPQASPLPPSPPPAPPPLPPDGR